MSFLITLFSCCFSSVCSILCFTSNCSCYINITVVFSEFKKKKNKENIFFIESIFGRKKILGLGKVQPFRYFFFLIMYGSFVKVLYLFPIHISQKLEITIKLSTKSTRHSTWKRSWNHFSVIYTRYEGLS